MLSEEELYCLAQHYNSFLEQAKRKEKANWGEPCEICKYGIECYCERKHPIYLDMEKKLPIKISHFLTNKIEQEDKCDS